MRIALDTNRYTDFARGEPSIAALIDAADEVVIPFVVAAELRSGFTVGSKAAQNEKLLAEFLAEPGVRLAYPDDETIQMYAALYRDLRVRGKMIPVHDLWIAAIVMQHGLTLCTRDAHFSHLPQIIRA